MDKQTLIDTILRDARKDYFNGVGRVFMGVFLRTHQVDEKAFLEAIHEMQELWKGIEVKRSLVNDEIFLFHLADSQITSK